MGDIDYKALGEGRQLLGDADCSGVQRSTCSRVALLLLAAAHVVA
jgi:hypothetical protein